MSKKQKLSDQVDSILSNRQRRFSFLMRKDRYEDAIALGDEFYEWFAPTTAVEIEYFDAEELADIYQEMMDERLKKKKKRGRGKSKE